MEKFILDPHTQHTSLMFNDCLFHLCDYTCSNVMRVCSTVYGSNQKEFCSFYLLLEVICITHVFQVIFVWKTCFWVFSWLISWVSLIASLDREFCKCFARRAYSRKFLAACKNSQINFLKDISWDICFKFLTSSPKPLF